MKRILIITYYWPPSGGSGVQRWLKFSKYLPQYGWQPVIYTPENPDFSIKDISLLKDIPKEAEVIKRSIWEPYQLYRKLSKSSKTDSNFGNTQTGKSTFGRLASWLRGNWFIPDPRVFWVKPSIRLLHQYLKENPVDAMATTGPPHSMHLIGMGLKKLNPHIKWISDMRDPWANFDLLNQFNLGKRAKQKQKKLEQQVLRQCDAVVMVSPSMPEEFNAFDRSKFHLIHNGFDHQDFLIPFGKPIEDHCFNIYHTGLLNRIRNPEKLWLGLEKLCETNKAFAEKLRLVLIGTVDAGIKERLANSPVLKNKIRLPGYMAHQDLLKAYAKADVMLMVVNQSRNAKAQLVGKLYEYLAVGKPILALGPSNADYVKILKDTGLGVFCNLNDDSAIQSALLHLFDHFQKNISIKKNQDAIDMFRRDRLTKKLVDLLNALL